MRSQFLQAGRLFSIDCNIRARAGRAVKFLPQDVWSDLLSGDDVQANLGVPAGTVFQSFPETQDEFPKDPTVV